MKEELIQNVIDDMAELMTDTLIERLGKSLSKHLDGVDVTMKLPHPEMTNTDFVRLFIAAKRVEGCSEKSLAYYHSTITKMYSSVEKWIKLISTDDLRRYLADYQETNGSSKVTIDNIRRILSSFFSWLEDEDYISKSPVRRIHKVKTMKVVKEALSDEEMEVLRDTADNLRDLTIIEMLASTGIRVGELARMNISDVNFEERSSIVLGKGNSQREIYFDARTKLHLMQYLGTRKDNGDAVFVSKYQPNSRLTINAIESIVKELGINAKINKLHPHKFRRTLATRAIDKGMPVEQVQRLLGHVRIDTTMQYALVNQTNVKNAHRKYIG
ncbi:integrase [Periweissella cryptocerci]|uniref:Integrase n=1 Tax=Periweissella cryptocerci TaxID=2506420 RepID=A0A4P6YSX9_9LACO|nr:site-specific tyrosine recombinase/integron integrase [Periweissella cryptocerci]QBO35781.1 integrase [Periweissella cryptocerci]